jgi:hypothetical protein
VSWAKHDGESTDLMQFIKRWIIIGGKRQEGGGEIGGRG